MLKFILFDRETMSTHSKKQTPRQLQMIVVYIFIVLLAVWLAIITTHTTKPTEWSCVQQTCILDEPGGELWAQQNCGFVTDEQTGQQIEACQITTDGQIQTVRKSEINLSVIRNCLEYACVQEVRVRDVNYILTNSTD
jgi:hypothetical protein